MLTEPLSFPSIQILVRPSVLLVPINLTCLAAAFVLNKHLITIISRPVQPMYRRFNLLCDESTVIRPFNFPASFVQGCMRTNTNLVDLLVLVPASEQALAVKI